MIAAGAAVAGVAALAPVVLPLVGEGVKMAADVAKGMLGAGIGLAGSAVSKQPQIQF